MSYCYWWCRFQTLFYISSMLKHPDYEIICLDSLTYAGNLSTLKDVMDNPNFKFVKLDIRDREGVYKLFEEEKPDVVVNFAAETRWTVLLKTRNFLEPTLLVLLF